MKTQVDELWHVTIKTDGKVRREDRRDKRDAEEIARRAIVTADFVAVEPCKGRGCQCGAL